MPKLQFSFSLGHWLFVCHFECYHFHGPSKVGLTLLYLCLSPHFPWLVRLASVVFLCWPRCLFCISCSRWALAFRQFLQNLWARSWLENLLLKQLIQFKKFKNELKLQLWFDGQLVLTCTQVAGWQHNQLVRSFFSVLPYFILPFPAPLERFAALSAAYPPGLLPVHWTGLVSVRSGFLWTCCCNEPHRLDNHQRAVI